MVKRKTNQTTQSCPTTASSANSMPQGEAIFPANSSEVSKRSVTRKQEKRVDEYEIPLIKAWVLDEQDHNELFTKYLQENNFSERFAIISLAAREIRVQLDKKKKFKHTVAVKKIDFLYEKIKEYTPKNHYADINLSDAIYQLFNTMIEVVCSSKFSKSKNSYIPKINFLFDHLVNCDAFFNDKIIYVFQKLINFCRLSNTPGRNNKNSNEKITITGESIYKYLSKIFDFIGSNTLYIKKIILDIAELAKMKVITGRFQVEIIDQLLTIYVEYAVTAKDISNILYKIGLLARDNFIYGLITNQTINQLIRKLPTQKDCIPQSISITFYGIGLLAHAKMIKGKLNHEIINELMEQLFKISKDDPQAIANTLYGIGLLAKANLIDEPLDYRVINQLMNQLTTKPDCNSQKIANILYGIGLLAQANLIDKPLDHLIINKLMNQLTTKPGCNSQEIANTFYGIGLLAQANLIDEPLDHQVINQLMNQLTTKLECNSQAIANTLYGIGLLAQANLIDKPLDHRVINQLMEQLTKMTDCKSQEIANALYGIGLIAQAKMIQENFKHEIINKLMEKLANKKNYTSQHITNTLYGIGLLTQADLINEPLDHRAINQLMEQLTKVKDCKAQAIANTLYGAGLLAQANLINKPLDHRVINQLMEQLTKMKDCNSQDIANTLYGIGLLAQANLINGLLNHQVIEELMTKLASKKSYIPQDIANALYGIGLLIQAKKIKYQLQEKTIKNLLRKLLNLKNLTVQEISNTLYGISLLKDNHALTSSAYVNEVTNLLSQMKKLPSDSSTIQGFCNAIYAVYLLFTNTTHQNRFKNIVTDIIQKIEKRLDLLSIEEKNQLFIVKITWDIEILPGSGKTAPKTSEKPKKIQKITAKTLAAKPDISQVKCEHIVQCWPIDIYLKMGNQPFLIELDGPPHYTTDPTNKMQGKWQSTCTNTYVFNQSYQALCHRDQLRDDFLYKKHQGITLRIANYFNYTSEELADIIYKKCQQIHTKNLQQQSCEAESASLVRTTQPMAMARPSVETLKQQKAPTEKQTRHDIAPQPAMAKSSPDKTKKETTLPFQIMFFSLPPKISHSSNKILSNKVKEYN